MPYTQLYIYSQKEWSESDGIVGQCIEWESLYTRDIRHLFILTPGDAGRYPTYLCYGFSKVAVSAHDTIVA